jgi:hypothetical protein
VAVSESVNVSTATGLRKSMSRCPDGYLTDIGAHACFFSRSGGGEPVFQPRSRLRWAQELLFQETAARTR